MSSKRSCWEIYNKQMSEHNNGHALWEPTPHFKRIQLGDVGYVRRGCFHLLFSAGRPLDERQLGVDVPHTFKQLDVGPIFNTQPRLPGHLSSSNIREIEVRYPPSASTVPMLEPSSSISVQLEGDQGAVLVTKYPTYQEDVQLIGNFEKYTKDNYDSWVVFAREVGHGNDVKPILVTGIDMTRDFAMMACSNNGDQKTFKFTTSATGVGSVWGTWQSKVPIYTNSGPHPSRTPSPTQTMDPMSPGVHHADTAPHEYDQCVFIRYYTMRKRLGIPKIIKAGAGPHDLGPGDHQDGGSQSDSQSSSDSGSDISDSLCDDYGDGDESSVTSVESEPDVVIHNTTADEKDDFDEVADYVFRNSDADSVLIHHQDFTALRGPGDKTELSVQLLEKLPKITVDDNGVGSIVCDAEPLANTRLNDPPAVPQESWKPLTTYKVSDPSTSEPTTQPIVPPSWSIDELRGKLLHDKEWMDQLEVSLEGDLAELVGLAGHLNDILNRSDSTGSLYKKSPHLQNVCSSREVFSSTYEVSDELSPQPPSHTMASTSSAFSQNTSTALPPSSSNVSKSTPSPLPSTSNSHTLPPPASTSVLVSSSVKQRRVSLALPSYPRNLQTWSFSDDTRLDLLSTSNNSSNPLRLDENLATVVIRNGTPHSEKGEKELTQELIHLPEKLPRKKWTHEETQNLVRGCNKWGVGNWKAILKDPELVFDNRSPVDLKDRFRTYFPDAYKQHYPNAKTHLSHRIRSSLPDGKSLFEKTRSKKRRPFTEEEDRALRAGYEKHGTLWAQIVKDPVFQEQKRRSTDLRDRFRNAFPDLYEAAGYRPSPMSEKKRIVYPVSPIRAAADDQIPLCLIGPSRRKRANTNEGLFRRGTESVPQSVTNLDDETSGDEMDCDLLDVRSSGTQPLPMHFRDVVMGEGSQPIGPPQFNAASAPPQPSQPPASASDIAQSSSRQVSDSTDSSQQSQIWCPTPDPNQWPGMNPGSPTSSHVSNSETFMGNFPLRPQHMIGKSAWGVQDWFSANPRLDRPMSLGLSNDGSIYGGSGLSPTPSSPFSFNTPSHDLFDRHGLAPSVPHDVSGEVGFDSIIESFFRGTYPEPLGSD